MIIRNGKYIAPFHRFFFVTDFSSRHVARSPTLKGKWSKPQAVIFAKGSSFRFLPMHGQGFPWAVGSERPCENTRSPTIRGLLASWGFYPHFGFLNEVEWEGGIFFQMKEKGQDGVILFLGKK